jgi:RimJ/RimL family protein N-acetyltransferase
MATIASVTDIDTQRLLLRPLQRPDVEPLFKLFATWEVIRWLSMPPWPYAIEDARDFIEHQLGQSLERATFGIWRDSNLIGGIDVRLNPAGRTQRGPGLNLGYWLGRPYWGRGYMTEAARGFLGHVFAVRTDDLIYSGAFAENIASLRVQEKIGFVRDGEVLSYARPRDGEFPHVNTVLTRGRYYTHAV